MYTFLIILIILVGILLGAVVLIQNPKGGGLSGTFGGVGQQLLGARRSTDVIEKMTWGFAAALLLFCFSTSFFVSRYKTINPQATTTNSTDDAIIKRGMHAVPAAPAGTPAAPAQK